jgi:hypothetical protein
MARDKKGAAWQPLTLVEDDLKNGTLVKAGAPALDVPIDIRLFHFSRLPQPGGRQVVGVAQPK